MLAVFGKALHGGLALLLDLDIGFLLQFPNGSLWHKELAA